MNAVKPGRKKASITDIDAQILELQRRRKELQAKEAERLGRLAMAAGVSDFEVSDEDLMKAFEGVTEQLRARFQPDTKAHEALTSAHSDTSAQKPVIQA